MSKILLALVNTPGLRDAIEQNAPGFDIRWAFEPVGYEKADETGRREIAGIAELGPSLIVIELDRPAKWLPGVRADPATRRIPVIAIAADEAAKFEATEAEVNTILTPEAFREALPNILTRFARTYGAGEGLLSACDATPSVEVLKGLHEFNSHEFFEAHETLEAAWNKETGPVRELYRAILQIGVAYLQIERGNYWGAHKLFIRALQWFAPMPDYCQGINVAQIRADAAAARAHLETLGPERVKEFDRSFFKPINYEGAPT